MYTFTKKDYHNQKLKSYLGLDKVPQKVINVVKKNLKDDLITAENIKRILYYNAMMEYYDMIPSIRYELLKNTQN